MFTYRYRRQEHRTRNGKNNKIYEVYHLKLTSGEMTIAVGEISMQGNIIYGINGSRVIHDSVDSEQHIYDTINEEQSATHQQ